MSDTTENENNKPSATPTAEEIAEALQPGNDNEPTPEELAEEGEGLEFDLGEDGLPDPFIVLERLRTENDELNDKLLRAAAEMQNIRKRGERERQEAGQYAATGFARDIISVADNLARALQAMGDDAKSSADEATKNLIDGIEMTERDLLNVFQRHGITRIDPEGERFDPNMHEAMFEAENADLPAGTIMSVAQCGYKIADRVLRPAMVGVSKGGPKATPETKTEESKSQS
ncbi:MAG: nucleotide exchange factor GrpE [Alphaproteobacteria bacterium]|nr:nucleotide exchange factor GrpE [Alphaproteobacteria bacterium]